MRAPKKTRLYLALVGWLVLGVAVWEFHVRWEKLNVTLHKLMAQKNTKSTDATRLTGAGRPAWGLAWGPGRALHCVPAHSMAGPETFLHMQRMCPAPGLAGRAAMGRDVCSQPTIIWPAHNNI